MHEILTVIILKVEGTEQMGRRLSAIQFVNSKIDNKA